MVGNGRRRQQLTLAGRQDSSPLGPVVLNPRPRTQPVLGMTLHRKSLQPVGSHRSNPHPPRSLPSSPSTAATQACRGWGHRRQAGIKVTLCPDKPGAAESLPP